MTEKEAIALHDSGEWKGWSDYEKVKRQLFEPRLFMPFSEFHRAVEAVLGRPVFTHEFAGDHLQKEFNALPEPADA